MSTPKNTYLVINKKNLHKSYPVSSASLLLKIPGVTQYKIYHKGFPLEVGNYLILKKENKSYKRATLKARSS